MDVPAEPCLLTECLFHFRTKGFAILLDSLVSWRINIKWRTMVSSTNKHASRTSFSKRGLQSESHLRCFSCLRRSITPLIQLPRNEASSKVGSFMLELGSCSDIYVRRLPLLTHICQFLFTIVETVGDCYVGKFLELASDSSAGIIHFRSLTSLLVPSRLAIAGLPTPRKDHASVMARFATKCRDKMPMMCRALEPTLGTDDMPRIVGYQLVIMTNNSVISFLLLVSFNKDPKLETWRAGLDCTRKFCIFRAHFADLLELTGSWPLALETGGK
jgi:hypothetical protein